MAWLPATGEGLQGWGAPPDFRAAPIEGLLRSIWALRERQRGDVQDSLVGAIQQYERNRVANALTKEYGEAGMIPSSLEGQGALGLAGAQDWMHAQKDRLYPTQLGGKTYNLSNTDRVRLAIAGARAQGGALGGIDSGLVPDPSGRTTVLGYYGAGGRWIPARPSVQPGYKQSQRVDPAVKRRQSKIDELQKIFGLTADDLEREREYGTSEPDFEANKQGRLGSGFTPTEMGTKQDWVRIKSPSGREVIMRRDDFENFHNEIIQTPADDTAPPTSGLGSLNEADQKALAWADAHPDDPRAAEIKQQLGVE